MPLRIRRRTRLTNDGRNFLLRYLHREEAEKLLAAGAIVADEVRGEVVVSFRLTGQLLQVDARCGSFGVYREHVPVGRECGLSGGVVFSHRHTYDELKTRV